MAIKCDSLMRCVSVYPDCLTPASQTLETAFVKQGSEAVGILMLRNSIDARLSQFGSPVHFMYASLNAQPRRNKSGKWSLVDMTAISFEENNWSMSLTMNLREEQSLATISTPIA